MDETVLHCEMRAKKAVKEREFEEKVFALVPDLRSTPYVRRPLICKLRLHNDWVIVGRVGDIDIQACTNCGVVLLVYDNHRKRVGYFDPNKNREFKD